MSKSPHHQLPTEDWLTAEGAHRLARRIESYWRDAGKAVECRIVPISRLRDRQGAPTGDGHYFVVRSNMIAGSPRLAGKNSDAR